MQVSSQVSVRLTAGNTRNQRKSKMEAMDIFIATTRELSYLVINHPIITAVGVLLGIVGLLRFYCRLTLGVCNCDQDMTGKTVLITGASNGIGKATAYDLARRNARVLLACRNVEKGSEVAEKIQEMTGNSSLVVKYLDLCSFESVRKCANDILETENKLHVLINNAGITGKTRELTEDGCEKVMQSNHLGHFLLTLLLLDLMKRSSPSRIINVSSAAYNFAKLDIDDLNNEKNLSPFVVYSNSKLANILFTRELSSIVSGTGVTVNSLHPGIVKTSILQNGDGLFSSFSKVLFFVLGKTADEGAQTTIHLAVAPELEATTGKFFIDCKEAPVPSKYLNPEMSRRLVEKSEEIVVDSFAKS